MIFCVYCMFKNTSISHPCILVTVPRLLASPMCMRVTSVVPWAICVYRPLSLAHQPATCLRTCPLPLPRAGGVGTPV